MSKYSENMEFSYKSSDGKTDISARVWEDEKVDPRAILQISHGMTEYKERYNRFAKWMASRGILVCANDHVGHGDSVQKSSDLGYVGDEDQSNVWIEDMHTLHSMMHEEYPELPYFMLGHSMGSFLVRQYLAKYAEGTTGAILVGTGNKIKAAGQFGSMLCTSLASLHGWRHISKLVENITHDKYYAGYDLTGKDAGKSWLTRDTEIVTKYYRDPKCTYKFSVSAYKGMFDSIIEIAGREGCAKIPRDLPILISSGSEDPVGGLGSEVKKFYSDLKETGHTDVELKIYDGDRHEILNEINREDVYNDIRSWILRRV